MSNYWFGQDKDEMFAKFTGEDDKPTDVYDDRLAPHAPSDAACPISDESRITPRLLLGGGGAAFVLLFGIIWYAYSSLDNKIVMLEKKVDVISIRLEQKIDSTAQRFDDKLQSTLRATSSLAERVAKMEALIGGLNENTLRIESQNGKILDKIDALKAAK